MKVASFIIFIVGLSLSSASTNIFENLQVLKDLKENNNGRMSALLKKDIQITNEMILEAFRSIGSYLKDFNITNTNDDEEPPVFPNPVDIQCGFQLWEAFTQVRDEGELWPLELLDSWAKVQSGFGRGNIRNTGHFTQCINVNHKMIDARGGDYLHGQHCTVAIRPVSGIWEWPEGVVTPPPIVDVGGNLPDGLFLDFGMCLPAKCRPIIGFLIMNFVMMYIQMEPTPFFLINGQQMCHTAQAPPLQTLDIVALTLIGLGFGGVILSTIYEVICLKLKAKPSELAAAMSVYSNGKYLFNLRRNKDHLQSLYGLRALSLIWIALGYRFILSVALPLINPLDFVTDFAEGYFSPWVLGSQYGIDTLLFTNATLITYLFMNKLERTGRVRIWKLYIFRFMRISPFVGILILLTMTLTKYSNDGPYYTILTEAQIPACEQYWWSAMLHVQNYVNPNTICILHTWFFSVDMQLYWAAPLILFPLFFLGGWFLLFIALVVVLTIACAATVSYFYGFQAVLFNMLLNFTQLMKYLRMVFFATHVRMGPWLIGVFCGYIVYKNRDRKFKLPWIVDSICWVVSISGIIAVVYLLYPFQQILDNQTSDLANVMYIGFARNIFALCLTWFVYGCHMGSGGPIRWLFTISIWQPISRMGISFYIITLAVQIVFIASQKTALVFGTSEMLHAFNGDLLIIFLFSSMTFLMVERPIVRTMKFILSLGKNVKKMPLDSAENNELTFKRIDPWKSFY